MIRSFNPVKTTEMFKQWMRETISRRPDAWLEAAAQTCTFYAMAAHAELARRAVLEAA